MSELDRRKLLRVGATTALAGMAAPPSHAQEAASPALTNGTVRVVASRSALLELSGVSPGDILFLSEEGREGLFRCCEGPIAGDTDPLGGLFLPARARAIHYERIWDGRSGRPEWFGARADDPKADCADAIEACYRLCPVTLLSQADYHVRRTLRLFTGWRTVSGVGSYATGTERGTRIILPADAPGASSIDIVHVGIADRPGSEADLVTEIHVGNVTLLREAPCAAHPSGDIALYPAGLRATFLLRCVFAGITSLESSVGFHMAGVVYAKFDDCFARRLRAGTGAGRDRWVGYYLNGHVSFGYAGGNASLYMSRCLVTDQNAAHADPVGLLARGAFVDSFIDHFESARIATGMAFAVDGQRGYGQTIDLHIRNAVLDGCATAGIDIDLDATSSASIEILDPYVASAGGTSDAGIAIHGGAGLTTITGGQVHGNFRNGSIAIDRSFGIRLQGTKLHNASRPVVVGEASGLVLEPQISNYAHSSANFAIECDFLSRSTLRPTILGAAGPAFRGGVSLGVRSRHCEIDTTGIDPACFTVPDAAFKLWFGAADARHGDARTAFTAAGNIQCGVID